MTRLKQILEGEGRKQTWLAEQIGVERSLVNKYVNGLIPPDDVKARIAATLGREVDDVFGEPARSAA